jgi:uncharacterized protein YndB with AHSA1/START domain
MSTSATEQVVRKSVLVDAAPEEAFRVFTQDAGSWWPLDSHSLLDGRATELHFEPREGGRVFERAPDGAEADWGTLLAWEPPVRFEMTWEVGAPTTRLSVRFSPEAEGTRIELEHGGWEAYGDDAGKWHESYDGGWDHVLGRFAARLGSR